MAIESSLFGYSMITPDLIAKPQLAPRLSKKFPTLVSTCSILGPHDYRVCHVLEGKHPLLSIYIEKPYYTNYAWERKL